MLQALPKSNTRTLKGVHPTAHRSQRAFVFCTYVQKNSSFGVPVGNRCDIVNSNTFN